ncbi:hypothetical protein EBT31_07950 [bacterium]|nr:hypothetical protein [bacterium]NBX49159.1 hypothetical protein [bacterium]
MKRKWNKKKELPEEHVRAPLTLEGELTMASLDPSLPFVDLHGLPRDAVAFELEHLMYRNLGKIVRIIYGHGSGIVKEEVLRQLRLLMEKKESPIEGFIQEMRDVSCLVKVR